ncbi:hypothetical protein [Nocardia sp. R7R-8]
MTQLTSIDVATPAGTSPTVLTCRPGIRTAASPAAGDVRVVT